MCTAVVLEASLKTQCPRSQAQRGTHPHTLGHGPEPGPTCGAPKVGLLPLLQQARGLSGSADMVEERVIDDRVAAAKLRLSKRSTTRTVTADSSRSATERREEDICGEWRDTNDLAPVTSNGASAARGVWGARYRTVGGWLPPIASLAWSASWKTHGGPPTGGDDRFGVAVRERTGVPAGERFAPRKYCRWFS